MHFLNPAVLFALAAAALPVVIHLLSRRRTKTVAFPSIEFLERMKTDRMRRLRMKQLLVLLLRTMIVALIVLAFARPAMNSAFRLNASTAAIIIIDNSAGMQYVDNGERLSEIARRNAAEILAMLGDDDQAAVIVANSEPQLIGGGLTDARELADDLGDIGVSWNAPNTGESFRLAAELLSGAAVTNRECYYLTDCDAAAIPDSIPPMPDNTRLYIVQTGPEEHPGAVLTGLSLNDRLVSPGNPVTFTATGRTGPVGGAADVEIFVDGERTSRTAVETSPGAPFAVEFTYTPERTGWYSMSALVNDGRFPEAETRRMVLHVPSRTDVLIVGDMPGDLYFPERVLGIGGENAAFRARAVLSADLRAEDLAVPDVIVLSGVTTLDPARFRSLVTAVTARGAGLIVFTPRELDAALYADGIFRSLFPATVERRIDLGEDAGTFAVIDRFDLEHPIMRDIAGSGEFTKPEVRAWHRIMPDGDTSVLARFSDGSMAIGETAAGSGRVVVFGVSASGGDSDLPLTGVFVPLFLRSVQYLSGSTVTGGQYTAGESIRETVRSQAEVAAMTVKPDDRPARQVEFTREGGQYLLSGDLADAPGFYSIVADGAELGRYSVDIPVSEAEFERADEQRLDAAFRGVTWKTLDSGESISEVVDADRYGTELFGVMLLAALALIAVEMVVSRKA